MFFKTAFVPAVLLLAASGGHAGVIIDLYPHLSPIDAQTDPPPAPRLTSPSYADYAQNVLTGLRTGQAQVGGNQLTDPRAFNTIGAPIQNGVGAVKIGIFDVMGSVDFNTWRGQLNPAGNFSGEWGTHFRTAVRISDSVAFTANDVTFFGVYPDFPDFEPLPIGLIYAPGSDRLTGLYWGQDGIVGTADDVLYDIGNPGTSDSLINQLFFIGFGDLGFEGLGPEALPGDDLLALADWESIFGSGYNFSHTYSLRGVSSTVNVSLTPEPSTMLGVALGMAVILRKRRN